MFAIEVINVKSGLFGIHISHLFIFLFCVFNKGVNKRNFFECKPFYLFEFARFKFEIVGNINFGSI